MGAEGAAHAFGLPEGLALRGFNEFVWNKVRGGEGAVRLGRSSPARTVPGYSRFAYHSDRKFIFTSRTIMAKQRISYVPVNEMDAAMRAEMERCAREGTPRPESSAVRAHVPACFWFFAHSWNDIFRNGVLD